MREYLLCCFPLPCHPFGAALAHAHTVPPAPTRKKRPRVVQFHDLADGAFQFSPRRIDGQAEVLGPDPIALSRGTEELDFRESRKRAVVALTGGADISNVSEPL